MAWLSSVMLLVLRGDGDRLGQRAELELDVDAGDARRAQDDPGLLVLLEVGVTTSTR